MPKVAILIVNGFDRRDRWGSFNAQEAIAHPWIDLSLRQITRHSQGSDYDIHIFDNSRLPQHHELISRYPTVVMHPRGWKSIIKLWVRKAPLFLFKTLRDFPGCRDYRHFFPFPEFSHPAALDYLFSVLDKEVDYFITMDNDSFPIRDGWIEFLVDSLDNRQRIVGVFRDEMVPMIQPFIHVSCLCMRASDFRSLATSFSKSFAKDVGQNITIEIEKRNEVIVPLKRSNIKNYHYLMGGIYGDLVYHHGAGSRHAKFWTSDTETVDDEERVRLMLRDRVFADLESLVEELTGRPYNE